MKKDFYDFLSIKLLVVLQVLLILAIPIAYFIAHWSIWGCMALILVPWATTRLIALVRYQLWRLSEWYQSSAPPWVRCLVGELACLVMLLAFGTAAFVFVLAKLEVFKFSWLNENPLMTAGMVYLTFAVVNLGPRLWQGWQHLSDKAFDRFCLHQNGGGEEETN